MNLERHLCCYIRFVSSGMCRSKVVYYTSIFACFYQFCDQKSGRDDWGNSEPINTRLIGRSQLGIFAGSSEQLGLLRNTWYPVLAQRCYFLIFGEFDRCLIIKNLIFSDQVLHLIMHWSTYTFNPKVTGKLVVTMQ